jgi:hypothetical protein
MDSGTAGIIGAAVGGIISLVGTLSATALRHYLRTRTTLALDKLRKERLKQMLSTPKYTWRSMENLASAIGADEETTAELLLQIGARKSMANRDNWALISRSPFPDDPPSNVKDGSD